MKCIIMITFFFFRAYYGALTYFAFFPCTATIRAHLLNSEITEENRKQIESIMNLSHPPLTSRAGFSSRLKLRHFRETHNFTEVSAALCGFGSVESSWQRDIKAASRLLLAANYIKQPSQLRVLEPAASRAAAVFSNFSLRHVCGSGWEARHGAGDLTNIKDVADSRGRHTKGRRADGEWHVQHGGGWGGAVTMTALFSDHLLFLRVSPSYFLLLLSCWTVIVF